MSGQTFYMSAVAPQLPYKVVLGHDLPILCALIPQVKHCNAVTRAQRASEMRALPFADDELVLDVESRQERKHLSRQEKHRQKMAVEVGQEKREWPQPSMALQIDIPTNMLSCRDRIRPWSYGFRKPQRVTKGHRAQVA